MCHIIEDHYGAEELGTLQGVLPEIVVFDYSLSDNITINQSKYSISYRSNTKPIRKYLNPNFILIERCKNLFAQQLFLEDKNNHNYTIDNFVHRINQPDHPGLEILEQDKVQLDHDDLGLFSGVESLQTFRNHITVGVPYTFNKQDRENLHAFSKFYE